MTRNTRIKELAIDRLLLDAENPRFGGNTHSSATQKELLSNIVDTHGVSDLLTSMSVNGFFDAEPVVAVENGDETYTVVEGNRRLAAALILTNSDRASDYRDITRKYVADSDKEKIESLKNFPVTLFPERNAELIAYIGAKHIRGNKPWDSYAKATWLFQLLSESPFALTIEDAARLLGDQNKNTVKRVLEGYVLMKQLIAERNYKPEDSTTSGKGSNINYPFSWVYTAIGYENIRSWIEIKGLDPETRIGAHTKVLHTQDGLIKSEKLVNFLFGSKLKRTRPAVRESREIKILNDIVKDRLAIKDLESGESAAAVHEKLRPANERALDLLHQNRKNLEVINNITASENLEPDDKKQFIELAEKSMAILKAIVNNLKK